MPTRTEYHEYITSEEWRVRRAVFLSRYPNCARCGLSRYFSKLRTVYDEDLHVHHKSYARVGCEEWEDLEPLCKRCHEIKTLGQSNLPDCSYLAVGTCSWFLYTLAGYFEFDLTEEYLREFMQKVGGASSSSLRCMIGDLFSSFTSMPTVDDIDNAHLRALEMLQDCGCENRVKYDYTPKGPIR